MLSVSAFIKRVGCGWVNRKFASLVLWTAPHLQQSEQERKQRTEQQPRSGKKRECRPWWWRRRTLVPRSQSAAVVQTCSPSAALSRWPWPPLCCQTQNAAGLVRAAPCLFLMPIISTVLIWGTAAGAARGEICLAACALQEILGASFKRLHV